MRLFLLIGTMLTVLPINSHAANAEARKLLTTQSFHYLSEAEKIGLLSEADTAFAKLSDDVKRLILSNADMRTPKVRKAMEMEFRAIAEHQGAHRSTAPVVPMERHELPTMWLAAGGTLVLGLILAGRILRCVEWAYRNVALIAKASSDPPDTGTRLTRFDFAVFGVAFTAIVVWMASSDYQALRFATLCLTSAGAICLLRRAF